MNTRLKSGRAGAAVQTVSEIGTTALTVLSEDELRNSQWVNTRFC